MANKFSKSEIRHRNILWKNFHKKTLQILALDEDVYEGPKGSGMYYFFSEKYGKIIIYPKGDRIHIPDSGSWIYGVDEWIDKNIVKLK